MSDGADGFVDRTERIVATQSIVHAGEIESATLSEARTTAPGVFVLPAVAAIKAELAVASANARTASSSFATSAEPDRLRDTAPTESVAATTDRSMPAAVRRGASPGAPSFTQQLRSAAIDPRANPSAPAMPDADRHAPSMNHRYGPPVLLQRATALAVSIVIVGCSVVQSKPLTGQPLSYAEQEPITGPIGLDTAIARAPKYNLDYRFNLMERALAEGLLADAGVPACRPARPDRGGADPDQLPGHAAAGRCRRLPHPRHDRRQSCTDTYRTRGHRRVVRRARASRLFAAAVSERERA